MNVTRLTAAVGLFVLAGSATAQVTPTTILEETFDTYADQAAFEVAWPPFFNTTLGANHPSMELSTEQALSGTKSAKNIPVSSAAGTAASPRNQTFFTDSGLPAADNLVHFEFDFYDTAPDDAPYRAYTGIFNSLAPSSSGGLVQMGMNNNQTLSANGGNYYMGRVFGYDPLVDGESVGGNGVFFKLNGVGTDDPAAVPLRSLGWHKFGVTISDLDFKFYVDGILARVVDRADGFNGVPVVVRSFDEIRLGAGVSNLDHASYVDNVKVVLNPIAPPTISADFDGNTIVDAADLDLWEIGYGKASGAVKTDGDADNNGLVDGRDFLIWQRQLTAPPVAESIPEPASAVLAGAMLLGLTGLARRRA